MQRFHPNRLAALPHAPVQHSFRGPIACTRRCAGRSLRYQATPCPLALPVHGRPRLLLPVRPDSALTGQLLLVVPAIGRRLQAMCSALPRECSSSGCRYHAHRVNMRAAVSTRASLSPAWVDNGGGDRCVFLKLSPPHAMLTCHGFGLRAPKPGMHTERRAGLDQDV